MSNVPQGYVILEVRVPRSGDVKTQLIREGGSRCADGDDKRLIDGVLNGNLPGFGHNLGETVGRGRTKDYWEQVKPKVPIIQSNPQDEDSIFVPGGREKQLDQGYGV